MHNRILKIVIGILLICTFFANVSGAMAAIYMAEDDLSDGTVGGQPQRGWKNITETVKISEDSYGRYLRIVRSEGDGDQRADRIISLDGKAAVDYYIKPEQPGGYDFAPYFQSNGKNFIKLFTNKGKLYANNGGEAVQLGEITVGKWLNMKVYIDFDSQKFDVYVNSELKAENYSFTEQAAACDGMRFAVSVRDIRIAQITEVNDSDWRGFCDSINAMPDSMGKAAVQYAIRRADEEKNAAERMLLRTDAKELADNPELEVRETAGENLVPPIPYPETNPHANKVFEGYANKLDTFELDSGLTYNSFDVGKQLRDFALALGHPESPLDMRENPKVLYKVLYLMDYYARSWNTGTAETALSDFAYAHWFPYAYNIINAVYPNCMTDSLENDILSSFKRYAGNLIETRGAIYAEHNTHLMWGNSDVRLLNGLYMVGIALNNDKYKELSDEGFSAVAETLLPDGGFNYVGHQNEVFTYHIEMIESIAWRYLWTRDERLKELILKTNNYYPLSIERGVAEYYTATPIKHYWNMNNAELGSAIVAYMGGDGQNVRLMTKTKTEMLLALLYTPDIAAPLPDPQTYSVFDKNIIGTRTKSGNFLTAITTRDFSYYPGKSKAGETKLIGVPGSTYVGAMVMLNEDEINASGNPKDKSWPLSAAIQEIGIEIKKTAGDEKETDLRRQGSRFYMQEQRNALTAAEGFTALSAQYAIGDKMNSTDSPYTALDGWSGRQEWIVTPERLVGIVELTADKDVKAYGLTGDLKLVSGRSSWGNQREMKELGNDTFQYGKLVVRIWEHNFNNISYFYTDTFDGNAKKSARLQLFDDVMKSNFGKPNTEYQQAVYKAGTKKYYVAEIYPSENKGADLVSVIDDGGDIKGLELVTDDGRIRIFHNTSQGEKDLTYSGSTKYRKVSLFESSRGEERDRYFNYDNSEGDGIIADKVMPIETSDGLYSGTITIPPDCHICISEGAGARMHSLLTSDYKDAFGEGITADIRFYADGNETDSLKEGGSVEVRARLENHCGSKMSGELMCAVYSAGRFQRLISVEKTELKAGENKAVSATIKELPAGAEVKVMWWDSLNSMKPLYGSKQIGE